MDKKDIRILATGLALVAVLGISSATLKNNNTKEKENVETSTTLTLDDLVESGKAIVDYEVEKYDNTDRIYGDYHIKETISYKASETKDSNGNVTTYYLPYGGTLLGNTGYVINDYYAASIEGKFYIYQVQTYNATKTVAEDGRVTYSAPNGGILSGTRVFLSKSVSEEKYDELLSVISENQSLTLR